MRCIVCGTEIPENCAFCPECGVKVESMEAAIPQPGDFSGQAAAVTSAEQGESAQPVASPGAPVPPVVNPGAPNGQPVLQPVFFDDNSAPIVTTGHWLATLLLLLVIPLVAGIVAAIISKLISGNIGVLPSLVAAVIVLVMEFIWAFSKTTNPSKRNFFRAQLIYTAIIIVLTIILMLVLGAMMMNGALDLGDLQYFIKQYFINMMG